MNAVSSQRISTSVLLPVCLVVCATTTEKETGIHTNTHSNWTKHTQHSSLTSTRRHTKEGKKRQTQTDRPIPAIHTLPVYFCVRVVPCRVVGDVFVVLSLPACLIHASVLME
mmetsp:Transcript_7474/g.21481  ORF Transcript_7474/g.21481 Transcript_7474/m.21481 type:complete len:112 (+) Transcript_7474:549-884(+)